MPGPGETAKRLAINVGQGAEALVGAALRKHCLNVWVRSHKFLLQLLCIKFAQLETGCAMMIGSAESAEENYMIY